MENFPSLDHAVSGSVSLDAKTLAAYSSDASIFTVLPQAVVSPKNAQDLASLVRWVSENKPSHPHLSITMRAAGTDMSGGPLNESIIVNTLEHFKGIGEIKENSIEVEPGVFYRDFEKKTLEKGLIMPSYPASRELAAMGGIVANNSGGEKSLAFGKTEKYVESVDVVLSDGQLHHFGPLDKDQLAKKLAEPGFEGDIYRKIKNLIDENRDLILKSKPNVTKNSAGYLVWNIEQGYIFNLAKLFVGSQGTLGLITKIKFNLVPLLPHRELLVMFLKDSDMKNLGGIVSKISEFSPESFESYDDHTMKLALRFLPEMVRAMKGSSISLFTQFIPEAWMVLTGGLPKLVLIAEFAGDSEDHIQAKMLLAKEAVERNFKLKTRVTRSEHEAQKYWKIRRESFNLLRKHVRGKHTAPFIDDFAVHPKDLPTFLPELTAILEQYPSLVYTIAGHAGDANFHIIPLMDLADEKQREIIPKLSNQVYDLVAKYGGTITAEHNDGLIRTPFLSKMYSPEILNVFSEVKKIFDPLNIFNPGKKVNGNLKYALDHIKHN